jgi:hypothetical protein
LAWVFRQPLHDISREKPGPLFGVVKVCGALVVEGQAIGAAKRQVGRHHLEMHAPLTGRKPPLIAPFLYKVSLIRDNMDGPLSLLDQIEGQTGSYAV